MVQCSDTWPHLKIKKANCIDTIYKMHQLTSLHHKSQWPPSVHKFSSTLHTDIFISQISMYSFHRYIRWFNSAGKWKKKIFSRESKSNRITSVPEMVPYSVVPSHGQKHKKYTKQLVVCETNFLFSLFSLLSWASSSLSPHTKRRCHEDNLWGDMEELRACHDNLWRALILSSIWLRIFCVCEA